MEPRGSLRWHFSASRKDTKHGTSPPPVAGSTFACHGQPTPRPAKNNFPVQIDILPFALRDRHGRPPPPRQAGSTPFATRCVSR